MDSVDIVQRVKQAQDDIQRETNKKLATAFREMERVQTQVLSKVTHDEVQTMTSNLADRSWVKSQMCHLALKSDMEAQLKSKISEHKFESRINDMKDLIDNKMHNCNADLALELQNRIQNAMQATKEHTNYTMDQIETKMAEKLHVLEKKIFVLQSDSEGSQKLASLTSKIDQIVEQGDRARLEVDKVKHSIKEKEKSQFSSSNQMISTFASQLREFETRENQ